MTYGSLIAYFFVMDGRSGTSNRVLFERWALKHKVDPDVALGGGGDSDGGSSGKDEDSNRPSITIDELRRLLTQLAQGQPQVKAGAALN